MIAAGLHHRNPSPGLLRKPPSPNRRGFAHAAKENARRWEDIGGRFCQRAGEEAYSRRMINSHAFGLTDDRGDLRSVDPQIGKLSIRKLGEFADANPSAVPAADRLSKTLQRHFASAFRFVCFGPFAGSRAGISGPNHPLMFFINSGFCTAHVTPKSEGLVCIFCMPRAISMAVFGPDLDDPLLCEAPAYRAI